MKLRRRHVLIYVIAISLVCLLIVFQSFDKWSRNNSINNKNKYLIEAYLDKNESKYLLDNNIDVNLFLPYIKKQGFNIENYEYYNLINEYYPGMSKAQIVLKGNALVNNDFTLKYLKTDFKKSDYTIDQLIELANPQSKYYTGIKAEFNPSGIYALANDKYYINGYAPKSLVEIDKKYTLDKKKMYLNEDANKQLKLMCDNLYILTKKNCGGLKVMYGYLSYDYVEDNQNKLENYIKPGHNDFQLGNSVMFYGNNNFEKNELYLWLLDNSYRFGFVQRYPSNKVDITKIEDNLGVFRYVGLNAAKEMHDNSITIEEKRGE